MKKWRITGICMAVSMLAASFSPAASAGETEAPEETQIIVFAAKSLNRVMDDSIIPAYNELHPL